MARLPFCLQTLISHDCLIQLIDDSFIVVTFLIFYTDIALPLPMDNYYSNMIHKVMNNYQIFSLHFLNINRCVVTKL
jgi:hypothetical protein